MDPGDSDEPSREELESRVAELEQTVSKMLPDRRGVLKGLGAAAVGGAAVGGATGGASGQSATGQLGTESEPVDVEAASLAAQSVSTGRISSESLPTRAVVYRNEDGDIEAAAAAGSLSTGSFGGVVQDAVDHVSAEYGRGEVAIASGNWSLGQRVDVPSLIPVVGYGRCRIDVSHDGVAFRFGKSGEKTTNHNVRLLSGVHLVGDGLANQIAVEVFNVSRGRIKNVGLIGFGKGGITLVGSVFSTVIDHVYANANPADYIIRTEDRGFNSDTPNANMVINSDLAQDGSIAIWFESGYSNRAHNNYIEGLSTAIRTEGRRTVISNNSMGVKTGEMGVLDGGIGTSITGNTFSLQDTESVGVRLGRTTPRSTISGNTCAAGGDSLTGRFIEVQSGATGVSASVNGNEAFTINEFINSGDNSNYDWSGSVTGNTVFEANAFAPNMKLHGPVTSNAIGTDDAGGLNGGIFVSFPQDGAVVSGNSVRNATAFDGTAETVPVITGNNFVSLTALGNVGVEAEFKYNTGADEPRADLSTVTPPYNGAVRRDDGTNGVGGEYFYATTGDGVWRAFSDPANVTVSY